jgi:hypothetical protein
MSSRQDRRLESRSQRQARQVGGGGTPTARRSRVSRTPVRVDATGSRIPWATILIGLGAVAVVAIIVFAYLESTKSSGSSTPDFIKAELDSSTSLPGTYVKPDPGPDGVVCTEASCLTTMDDRTHVTTPIPICSQDVIDADAKADVSQPRPAVGNCYNSNPPTSGNHNPQPAAFKIYDNPVPKENLVHSMEHGGVVVWYNTENQDVINQVKDVVSSELKRQKEVVMSKYTDMEPDTIALTSWTRLEKIPVSDFTSDPSKYKDNIKTFIEKLSKHFNPEGF